ncbi:MAG TPA: hypothetical protein VME63_17155 [Dyella sp.]|uniref:hypothetical protein n=1 Tax=Dyella sp. TaxID=1869338 RepID=UPI002BAC0A91|nr:hypothetical protein [Dyella sp.]HTV87130.1 hypothetical protein [Dyella sp.]
MSCLHGSWRLAVLAGLVALGFAGASAAQTAAPASGLGQSWPNAVDVSANPNWHVYVFMLNGIKYVQVNDLNGTVHAAIGTAGGTTIVLPVGVDAQHVSTTPSTNTSASSSSTVTVYSDATTTVTATPQSDGTTQFTAVPASTASSDTCDTYNCGGGRGS